MTVLLEEKLRDVSNLERERMRRFLPMVKELAAEEPEVLALLVDRLYHESLHEVPETSSVRASHGEAQETNRENKGRSGRRKPRSSE
jgi:ATP-dependent RNA helicase DeaD